MPFLLNWLWFRLGESFPSLTMLLLTRGFTKGPDSLGACPLTLMLWVMADLYVSRLQKPLFSASERF